MLNAADFPATLPVCADAVAHTPQHDLPYLQILPPFELLASPLYAQIDALARLYTAGRSVCAAVVGNGAAFEAGEDAEIVDVVYDPAGRTAPQDLLAAAEVLGSQTPQPPTGPDAPPSSSPTHTVAPGESLWSITAHLLPTGSAPAQIAQDWPALYRANSEAIGADPSLIRPGTVLSVPDSLSAPSTSAGGQAPSR